MNKYFSSWGIFPVSLLIMSIFFFWARESNATTWYVATNGIDSAAGTAWTNAVLTISNGVAKATGANAIVLVSNGVYILTTNVVIDKDVKVLGAGASRDEVIVNGNGTTRGFILAHASAMIERLTITNADARSCSSNGYGGGVYVEGSGSKYGMIRDCAILNCTATNGGGVYFYYGGSFTNGIVAGCVATNAGGGIYHYISAGTVRGVIVSNNISYALSTLGGGGIMINQGGKVISCEIVSNRAYQSAGGIYMSYANPAIVDGCIIKNNWLETSGGGGGVRLVGADCFLINSTISGNNALPGGSGGGVNFYQGTGSTVSNCVIVSNRADYAGGVYMSGTAPSFLKNNLIAYNTGTNYAGGVYWYKYASVQNCTIVSNVAGNDGGGLYCNQTGSVVNTIVYFNRALTGSNSNVWNVGAGMTHSNCCAAPTNGFSGSGNIETDPKFVDRDAGNFRLQGASPCVNAGLNQAWMTNAVDLDGQPRIRYGIVDIGCYENLRYGTVFTFW